MKGFLEYLKNHFFQGLHDFKHSKHTTSWIVIIAMLASSVAGVQYGQLGIQTSVLTLELPADFDGTVYPLVKTPKWHELTSSEYTLPYDQIPEGKMQEMPRYNPNTLQASLGDLGYSDEENEVRDAKITYSVAYLGNYQLDGVEYAGSHPAVDIKAPAGTPVVSIANGIVTKVSDDAYGFGLHVVVKHINVPTADGKTETLYSSYSHMNRIDVKEGDILVRGQQVGTVGDTGTSTVEHLHFQIDKGGSDTDPDIEAAPWHPYWPFTYSDYSSQGLSFFEAINQGLGQDNAIKYTVNPMTFVQSHLTTGAIVPAPVDPVETPDEDFDAIEEDVPTETLEDAPSEDPILVDEDPVDESENDSEVVVEDVPEEDAEVVEIPEIPNTDAVPTKPEYQLEFTHQDVYLVGNAIEFELIIKDMDGNVVEDPFFSETIMLASTDSDIAELETETLRRDSFENGKALVKALAQADGEFKIRLPFGDTIYESGLVTVREDVKDVHGFAFEHDGHFTLNEAETVSVIPVDEDGNHTAYTIVGDVTVTVVEGSATLSKDTLTIQDFADGNGVATVEVTPHSEADVVIEARHAFIKGQSEELISGAPLFSDLPESHENYEAIRQLKNREVISGYPDGTFKPNKGVSRVEALKLIFAGLEAAVPDPEALHFMLRDLYTDQWYAPYVAHAINEGVVKGYPDGTFKPAQTVNKAEFAKMLVLGLNIDIDLEVAPESPTIGTDVRPSDWFYPYVSFLVENGIIDLVDNKFNPAEPMDRAKVAEAIWRVVESQ